MRRDGTWGTERNILAAANMFGVDIVAQRNCLQIAKRKQRNFHRDISWSCLIFLLL